MTVQNLSSATMLCSSCNTMMTTATYTKPLSNMHCDKTNEQGANCMKSCMVSYCMFGVASSFVFHEYSNVALPTMLRLINNYYWYSDETIAYQNQPEHNV